MSETDWKISEHHSAVFREFIILPRKTTPYSALTSVDLKTQVAEGFPLAIPFLSAAMESVTGYQLAIALALQGGLGVLPAGRVEIPDQVRQIELVKNYRGGFSEDCDRLSPDLKLREVDRLEELCTTTAFPVVDREGRLLGQVNSRSYHPLDDAELAIKDKLIDKSDLLVFSTKTSRDEVVKTLLNSARHWAYLVDEDGRLVAEISRIGVKDELRYRTASRDTQGRLQVAAAISTHPEDRERAKLCVAAGADLLSIDASDGFSEYMKETIETVKPLGVPVIAGNIVCRESFEFLAECGADAVKVGIGSGSICTTRRVKAIGRGQATAVREVTLARNDWHKKTGKYIPLISDGSLDGTGDMACALAMGADALMMGKYFAGFVESPTRAFSKKLPVLFAGGTASVPITVKPYWGEASARAKNVRRYQQNDPRTFVIEGEEGYIVCKGSLHDKLPADIKALQGTLSSCGCQNLEEFRNEVVLERQSVGSQQEGGISIFQN